MRNFMTWFRQTAVSAIGLTTALLFLPACATYKLQYGKNAGTWADQKPPQDKTPVYTLYLIGDAGGSLEDAPSDGINLLRETLKNAPKESAVLFLGDNLYPDGMASKNDLEERPLDESKLKAQLNAVKDFPGRIFFIPGNHDWYSYGIDGLKRQRKFIENYLGRDKVWFPAPGCGDPHEINLRDDLVLVLLDSQWYLTDWEGETEINADCSVKDRTAFRIDFESALKSNRNKNVVVALHHPLYSNGPHGGQYTVNDHLFPLSALNKNLYLPLPVIGTLGAFLRANVGSRQDLAHPRYKALQQSLLGAAQKNGRFIFVSGHEHSLQYFEADGQAFIVSGSGSKTTATRAVNNAQFTYGHQGISKLDFYADGSSWTTFLTPEDGVVFRKQVKEALPAAQAPPADSHKPIPPGATVSKQIATKLDFRKKSFGRFFWGKHYRDAYHTPIDVPVLDFSRFKGGVRAFEQGGGFQTNSLRLVDEKTGKQYAMRSMDKDAARTVPYPFNASFALDIVEDNFSASHPFSAMVVSPLAEAAGVYHANPQLVYVPRQPGLNIYNDQFGDALYLIEERPDDDLWENDPHFGNPEKVVGTPDVLEAIQENQDHRVDQVWTVRSRLFDLLVGDWDRHDDQWRWSRTEENDVKVYRPIPRDRDQALSNYDGFFTSLARQTLPFAKQLRPFEKGLRKSKWGNYNGRLFDQSFLTGLEWSQWEQEARLLQEKVTDAVIDSALRNGLPPAIYAIDGPGMAKGLRLRREKLLDYAKDHYRNLARKVDVVGTEKRELFEVVRLENGQTRVNVYDLNKNEARKDLLYQRLFQPGETREIRLFGLDGDDLFSITGTAPKGSKVRAVGGLGKDEFRDESRVGGGKKTFIYDAESEKNKVEGGPETRNRISGNPVMNTYNRRSKDHEYDYSILIPAISGNPDDGLALTGIGQFIFYGFNKAPYASSHRLSAQVAFETGGGKIDYHGEFIDAFGSWEFALNASLQTALYASNYYGIGNTTGNLESELDEEFYRLRQRIVRVYPAWMKKLSGDNFFTAGPTFESIRVERTQGRLIDQIGDDIDPQVFDGVEYAGVHLQASVRNQDSPSFPTRGIAMNIEGGWKQRLDKSQVQFPYLDGSLTIYQRLVPNGKLVFAGRVGFEHRFNNRFDFFQAANLGGTGPNSNFRGFRRERFSGQTAFYNNLDLRWKLLNSTNRSLPFSFGLYAGFDHGRVWSAVEEPDLWHYSYGGGIYASPFDILTIQFGLFQSDENRIWFNFGGAFFF